MAISNLDIYRTANLMVKRYGRDGAPIQAAMRADEFLYMGDLDGQRTWRRILKAIDVLIDDAPNGGEILAEPDLIGHVAPTWLPRGRGYVASRPPGTCDIVY